MSSDDDLRKELTQHKMLLAEADAEISRLRDQVGQCATTVLETIMSGEQQEKEISFLRARVAELEQIVAQSEEQAQAAAHLFEAMQGAMGRMQETIDKVTEHARATAAAAELEEDIKELQHVAEDVVEDIAKKDPLTSFLKPL